MCQQPPDLPETRANETQLFGNASYASAAGYLAWAELVGELAVLFPHIVALGIDDFIGNIPATFTPQRLTAPTSSACKPNAA